MQSEARMTIDAVAKDVNDSSYKLFEHMNSFPFKGEVNDCAGEQKFNSSSKDDDHDRDNGISKSSPDVLTNHTSLQEILAESSVDDANRSFVHSPSTLYLSEGNVPQESEISHIITSSGTCNPSSISKGKCNGFSHDNTTELARNFNASEDGFVSVDDTKSITKAPAILPGKQDSQLSSETNESSTQKKLSSGSYLVVLLDNDVADITQAASQKSALNLLHNLHLPFRVLDQKDSSSQDEINELFIISGIRDNYPQIFVFEDDQYRFLGDYDWLNRSMADISKTAQGTALLSAVGQTLDTDKSSSLINGKFKSSITVLISSGVNDYLQKANQKAALQLLTDFKVPYTVVDGMDPSQIEKRNMLFNISGIRGNYPQLFQCKSDDGQFCFLGGYDWLEGHDLAALVTVIE
eukprot:scaffold304416_cov70-Cyclotella_meneghiniana.AAC.1